MRNNSATSCGMWERAISVMADGELEIPETLATLDHLIECQSCRDFYRQIRCLEVAVLTSEVGAKSPADETWERITARVPGDQSSSAMGSRRMAWAGSIAAAAVLAVGMWTLRSPDLPRAEGSRVASGMPVAVESAIEIELGGASGSMTETRFIALTTELLQADQRYHEMMLQVMKSAAEATELPYEGGGSEGGDRTEKRGRSRVSVGSADEDAGFSWKGAAF